MHEDAGGGVMSKSKGFRRLYGASLIALSLPGVARAQATVGTTPPISPVDASANTADVSDIIVTAQRRSERLHEVPISLAVVSGETLQNRSIQNFEQLAPLVPNLTVAKSPAANIIVLRGIGSSAGSPSLDQSVVMFIDGIYAGNARQFATPFLDIQRLEILRGPQGALVGRNTSAGAINIVTRKPGAVFSGYVVANYNFKFDGPTIEGGVDLPVSSALKLRVVGKYGDVDGYIHNTLVDQNQPTRREAVGRITGIIDNGGPVTLTAKYEHASVKAQGSPVQVYAPSHGEFRDYVKSSRLLAGPEYDNIRTDNGVVQFDFDLRGPRLVVISGYSTFVNTNRIDADFFARDFATADFDQNFKQLSQELRLISPSTAKIEYSLGAYYSKARLREERVTGVLFAPAASTYRRFNQDDEVFSVFGQVTVHLTKQLRINGSARYTHEVKDATYSRFAGPLAATARTGTLVASFAGHTVDRRVDPSASAQFDLTPRTMLYASFGKGSKSSGFQGAISNATSAAFAYKPESSTSFEAGAKFSLPGAGYFNVAAFHTIYHNLQVSAGIATPNSLSASFFTGNAPEARIDGLEADFSLRLASFFSLEGSASWLPTAKYVTFTAGPCYALQPSNGTLPGTCNQSGQRLGFAPRVGGSLNATFTAPIGSSYALRASASPIFQGGSYRDFTNDPVAYQRKFVKLDARIAFGSIDDRWEIAVVGHNLTDKLTNGYSNTAGLANTFLDPAARVTVVDPPRNIAIQTRLRF